MLDRLSIMTSGRIGLVTVHLKCICHEKYFRLLERPFKIQKNGVCLFEISFFVLEILRFSCYAN